MAWPFLTLEQAALDHMEDFWTPLLKELPQTISCQGLRPAARLGLQTTVWSLCVALVLSGCLAGPRHPQQPQGWPRAWGAAQQPPGCSHLCDANRGRSDVRGNCVLDFPQKLPAHHHSY